MTQISVASSVQKKSSYVLGRSLHTYDVPSQELADAVGMVVMIVMVIKGKI